MTLDLLTTHYNYYAVVLLLGIGLYTVIESPNLVKKVIGMNVFQTGIFLFFITLAYRSGGNPPVVTEGAGPYVSPLPHVLILTAIVVGVSLTAVALALVVRVYSEYGTLDEHTLEELYHD
ncbi:cation:proton antiporter subunit C [uncultured Halorubrum sp.]|jgi:multicomponent Na+:H+ antiporter subunit C|uniref:cation:proton antiporter subunit C n=1 Tax=uncultured Halorubrum sp. TaxID=399555 RepID=UPI002624B680|nr:cation:proton antiporter subunit C [uncultured Halorubrum sp.]